MSHNYQIITVDLPTNTFGIKFEGQDAVNCIIPSKNGRYCMREEFETYIELFHIDSVKDDAYYQTLAEYNTVKPTGLPLQALGQYQVYVEATQ